MFLQNFSTWKPFRAVAAFMLVLVMATACQETAQVINKQNDIPMAAKATKTEAEKKDEEMLIAQFQNDPNFETVAITHNLIGSRMRSAVDSPDKARRFEKAMANQNKAEICTMLGFSESELDAIAKTQFEARKKTLRESRRFTACI